MINSQAKQGYKHTPLGWIPEEWGVFEFSNLTIKSNEKIDPQKLESSTFCIELEHISQGTGEILGFVESKEQKSIKNIFVKDDILFGKLRPYLRKYWLADRRGVCSSEIWVLKANEQYCIPRFLFLLVQTHNFIQFANVSSGSKMPRADWDYTSSFPCALPPLPEQKAIAKVLSTWDEAISKTQELITQKELRKKWLMQQLLTGKKRLKGFKGEWKKVQLGEIFERVTRKNNGVSTNVVTISAQRGFVRQGDFFNKIVASETLDNYYLIKKGEFCYNKSYSNGYNWGATKRLNDFDEAVVTTLYICFRLKNVIENSGNFFEFYFDANLLDEGLTQIAHEGGRAHGLLNVTPIDFFNLIIRIPSFEEQQIIAEIIKSSYEELRLFNKYLELLKNQKQGLMQVLLSGKKRI